MCGILGVISKNTLDKDRIQELLLKQKHRGPDNESFWMDDSEHLVMGHNRLSIIDLSTESNQPFFSQDERYVIIFNGEIYNYLELKKSLSQEFQFRTKSDTEVLLYSYVKWGRACLEKLNGMFAFAIYDRKEKKIFIARDRFGVKPVYYFQDGDHFMFASELAPFFTFKTPKTADVSVWASFFKYGTYGSPKNTFWKDVYKLPGGHYLEYQDGNFIIAPWYDFVQNILHWQDTLISNEEEYAYELLNESIQLRFRSDVPVGFNLSGGLDSSTLLAFVYKNFPDKNSIKAFSFYTDNPDYDELPWVEKMLQGKPFPLHTSLLKSSDIPKLSQEISDHQLEPYGGIPTIAYSQLFKLARELGVLVLLDGQGADEAWAGYDYYFTQANTFVQGVSSSPLRTNVLAPEFSSLALEPDFVKPFNDTLLNLQYRDLFYTKLPRALRFNDRVSMMYSTELREPFLDFRLVEFVFSRKQEFKIQNGIQKWMMRKMSSKLLGDDLSFAPKRPLQTPQREWLASELFDWAYHEIEILATEGWFKKSLMMDELEKFRNGRSDNSFFIWQWINAKQILKP